MTPNAMAKVELSEALRKLVEIMQQVCFGRVDDLVVQNGEPVFNPMPRIIREIKLGAESTAGPQPDFADFTLKGRVATSAARLW